MLLAPAGLLYSLGLSASGWASAYYSAAAQAGALCWQAFLFAPVLGAVVRDLGARGELAAPCSRRRPRRRLAADPRPSPPRPRARRPAAPGGRLLVVGVVLSSLRGISHSYHVVQLAPAVAPVALVAAAVAVHGLHAWPARPPVGAAILVPLLAGPPPIRSSAGRSSPFR